MGNIIESVARKISDFSCKSSCIIDSEIEKEVKERKRYIKSLSIGDFEKIKELMDRNTPVPINNNKITII